MIRTLLGAFALFFCLTTGSTAAPNADVLRICTGGETGNYSFAGNEIAKRLGNTFPGGVEIVFTSGSLDNLRKLSAGDCDIAFSQSDVADNYVMENPASLSALESYKTIYSEYVHLICPAASGFGTLADVASANGRIIVGADGSGSAETWRAIRQANPEAYDKLERIPDPVNMESVSKVKDSKNTCLLWVSGLNSADMQAANRTSVNTKGKVASLSLVSVDDGDFEDLTNSRGEPMYRFESIVRRDAQGDDPGLYGNLIADGWGEDSVEVPVVDALLVIRKDYKAAIGSAKSSRIIVAIEDAQPTIWNRVNPTQ